MGQSTSNYKLLQVSKVGCLSDLNVAGKISRLAVSIQAVRRA